MITWTTLIGLIVGYVAVISITTLLTQPARVRLVVLVDDMLDEPGWSKSERSMLEFLADSCMSTPVAVLVPFAAAYGLASAVVRGRESPDPKLVRLEADPRHPKLVALFILSIAGNSPFAVLLSVPFIILTSVVRSLRGEDSLSQAIDAPLRRVSSTFQTT